MSDDKKPICYAANNRISRKHFDGSIPISIEQYAEARAHILDTAMEPRGLVRVHKGKVILTQKPETLEGHKELVWDDESGDWYHEPFPDPSGDDSQE